MPLIEVVGSSPIESPSQTAATGLKIGSSIGNTESVNSSTVVSPQTSLMVTMYVVVVVGENSGFAMLGLLIPVVGDHE